jgi:hypothetical protein
VIDLGLPQPATVFGDHPEIALAILERRGGRFEVACVRQTERADWPEVGQAQVLTVVLADKPSRGAAGQVDAELDAPRDEHHVTGRRVEYTELGVHAERARLRNDQQLAIRVVKESVPHRRVGGVDVNGGAGLRRGIAVAADRHQPVHEVGRLGRNRHRAPPKLIGRRRNLVERTTADEPRVASLEWLVHRRRPDAIGPGRLAHAARRGERGAVQFLDVEAEWRLLRRVLLSGQRTGNGLGRELVSEARQVRAVDG